MVMREKVRFTVPRLIFSCIPCRVISHAILSGASKALPVPVCGLSCEGWGGISGSLTRCNVNGGGSCCRYQMKGSSPYYLWILDLGFTICTDL